MKPFHIAVAIYATTFMTLGLWSVVILKKRAGHLTQSVLQHRQEIGRRLREGAVSPWDPFHPQGGKRWQRILWIEFGILVLLGLFTR